MTSAEEGLKLGWEVEMIRLAWKSHCKDVSVNNLVIVINALGCSEDGPTAMA